MYTLSEIYIASLDECFSGNIQLMYGSPDYVLT